MSATGSAGPPFDRLVVIGDSLSDSGNAGRFSDGAVWVEQLAGRLSLRLAPASKGGQNFAVGGARLDPRSGPTSLRAQADMALRLPANRGRTLHVVWGGGNDLLAAATSPDALRIVDEAVASLAGILRDLTEHGATDILVPNLPDIGMTPAVRAYGPGAAALARQLTDRFNAGLEHSLRALPPRGQERRPQIHRMDVQAMAMRVAGDPASFGFRDVTTPCIGLPSCTGHLFWDHVHPTSYAHGRLAEGALRVLGGGSATGDGSDAASALP
ncbi:SGNH/GDSL hydrolase family protein [Arenibaculum pallidiluteum]|uniref:SGNH/GDSL hydrolase family protein n=1 Tax=Arenibaculum pallidiluteum TaxID=2812559 RepID=UPI001A9743A2|nr:SGNH/GDSL hydrolase family protein [Arenibaculum pallidiluteum]